jgi:GNAT superfamily N-acetyltransferase
MLPFLPLPLPGPATCDPPVDGERKESRKRRATAPAQNWAFFALPWGASRQNETLPAVGLEVFNSDKENLLSAARLFLNNASDGCGAPNIAEGLREELGFEQDMQASEHVMLVTGLFDVETKRVVALQTVSIGGSEGDIGHLVTGLQKRYTDGEWFNEQGKPMPLVTPSDKQLGGLLGYKERLTFYIEHLCTSGSATDEAPRLYGTGRSVMQQTVDYLKDHAARHVVNSYKNAASSSKEKADLATDQWVRDMLRRDLWVHVSASDAVEFYKKQGFEVIPRYLQEKHDPICLVRDNRMWRPLYMSQ